MFLIRQLISILLFSVPLAINAHHSVAVHFSEETVTYAGTIAELKWANPHSSLLLVVTNEDGTSDEYRVEFLSRIALERSEFNFDSLQNGFIVDITGRVGVRNQRHLFFQQAVLEDGRIVTARSPLQVR